MKLVNGFGINDYDGMISEVVDGKHKILTFYNTWSVMLQRCYCAKLHERCKTYVGCTVHSDWHSLSAFKCWFDQHYVAGWVLDKDLLVKGNTVYSEDTCVFVPQEINKFLTERAACRGDTLIGVSPDGERFRGRYRKGGKTFSKTFDDEISAHMFWKKNKCCVANELVIKYPLLDERAKKALSLRYEGDCVYS